MNATAPPPDLNQMIALALVVEHGSFRKAADALRVPSSTVSRRVAALEDRLGVRLLERTTRRVRVTNSGGGYVDACLRLLHDAEAAERTLASASETPAGTLRITCSSLFVRDLVAPAVIVYLRLHPDVSVECHVETREVDLVSEKYDIALRCVPRVHQSTLGVQRFGATRPIVLASPRYLAERRPPKTPADLSTHALAVFGHGLRAGRWTLFRKSKRVAIKTVPRLSATSDDLLRAACIDGLCLALLPPNVVMDDLKTGRLVRLLPQWTGESRYFMALTPSAGKTPALVREFVKTLATVVRRHPDLLARA